MKMNEIMNLILVLAGGGVLGFVFFAGLQMTVRKAVRSKRPSLLFAGSFIIRMAFFLLGFYYLTQGSLKKMIICFAGFLIVRTVILRAAKKGTQGESDLIKEVHHEN